MSDGLVFTLMGCGSSPGVPRPNGDWGACDPQNPKNRRSRPSLLIELFGPEGVTRCVVDTGPDFREQMLRAEAYSLDAVLYTHGHADHTHGCDDLRSYFMDRREPISVYGNAETIARLDESFGYVFRQPKGSGYPAMAKAYEIEAGARIAINGKGGAIEVEAFNLIHGGITILGYSFDSLAYCTDVSAIPDETRPSLKNLDVLIIDALQYKPHPSHFSVDEALVEITNLRPRRAILTHMHVPLDYAILSAQLPDGVEPGYDGLRIVQ